MTTRTQNRTDRRGRTAAPSDRQHVQRALWILRGRRALLECLLCAGEATGDEVRDVVELPPGIALNCFGGVPGPLAKAGVIRRARYEPTCRPAGRGRPITVWQLADRAAAKRWLYDHPDRPDGDAGSQGVILFSIDPNEPTPSAAADGA